METKDIISLSIASLAFVVSIISFVVSYRLDYKVSVRSAMPVLVFEYDGRIGWKLLNIGNGPALNVLVAQKKRGEWFNPVRIPPLARDSSFVPAWLHHVNTTGLGATYTDIEGRKYSSTIGNDLTDIHHGYVFGPWKEPEIGKHWNQPPYVED